jgi:hypothetical protein
MRASPFRADALVHAALACLELGDAEKAVTLAREGWEMGCEMWKDMDAYRAAGVLPGPLVRPTLGSYATQLTPCFGP